MQRRPAHSKAHATCPYGQINWADCDKASEHRFGHCKAAVGKFEPEPCSRWAFEEDGYCTQHYVARVEADKAEARKAITRAELDARIEAYIVMSAEHPSVWDSDRAPKGMAAGAGLEPATSRVTADRSTTELPRKKGPHRIG